MTTKMLTLALAAAVTLASGAIAQTTPTKLITGDQTFANKVISTGLLEVGLGKLALQKSSNASVKTVAQMMIDDHSKANDQLAQIMSTKGITASQTMLPEHQKDYDRLAALSGSEFDREYKQLNIAGHQDAVKEFQQNLTTLQDPELRTFDKDTLPTLQHHLKMSEDLDLSGSAAK